MHSPAPFHLPVTPRPTAGLRVPDTPSPTSWTLRPTAWTSGPAPAIRVLTSVPPGAPAWSCHPCPAASAVLSALHLCLSFRSVCGRIPPVPGQGVLTGVPRAADSVSPMSLLQTDGQERTPPCPCPLLPPQPCVLTESVSASPGPLHLPHRICPMGVPQAWGPVWGLSCAQRVRPPPRALSHFPRTSGGPGACSGLLGLAHCSALPAHPSPLVRALG